MKRWILAGIGISAMATTTAFGEEAWWSGNVNSIWNSNLANWNTSATSGTAVSALPGPTTDVIFSTVSPAAKNLTTSLTQNFTINSLRFAATGSAAQVNAAFNNLTLVASGGSGITVDGGRIRRINTNVVLGSPQTWTNNGPTGVSTLFVGTTLNSSAPGGQLTIAGTGNTTLTGTIGSNISNGLIKTGDGVFFLGGVNSFTGGVTVQGGTVELSADESLGAAGSGVIINDGGVLSITGNVTFSASRVVAINASAAKPASFYLRANLTAGAGNLQGGGTLQVASSSANFDRKAFIDGANGGFTGKLVASAPGQFTGGYFNQRHSELNRASTYLTLRNSGTLPNVSEVRVNPLGWLTIEQSTTPVTGRTGTAPLEFHSGRFTYLSTPNGGAAINDSFGPVTISGTWKINGSSTAGPAAGTTLNFGNLTRSDRATILFQAPAAGTQGAIGGAPAATSVRYLFANLTPDTTTAGTSRSVIPWATNSTQTFVNATPQNLMTYDANGFRPLDVATETTTTLTAGANVRLTAGTSIPSGGRGILSLNVSSSTVSGNATMAAPGNVLSITSGAVISSNGMDFTDASVHFPNGAYLYAGSLLTVSGYTRLTGDGGVTVNGRDLLKLTNNPNGGNTFTGGLSISGPAGVSFTANNQLGNDGAGRASGSILLGGGNLLYYPDTATTTVLTDGGKHRDISINESGGIINTARTGAILQVPGTISGSGQLQFGRGISYIEDGIVELTNPSANVHTGGTVVASGILRISNTNQMGSGPVIFWGGTLEASADLTFATAPILAASGNLDTRGFNISLNGGIRGSSGVEDASIDPRDLVLNKNGAGTLTINGASSFAGVLQVDAGQVLANGTLANIANIKVYPSTIVELGASRRLQAEAGLSLYGGTFRTGGFSEDAGVLSVLDAASNIDLGHGASRLAFAASQSSSWTGTLKVLNWSGRASGGGTDQISFSHATGLTSTQIARITFVDPQGSTPGTYPAKLLSTGELVPVVPDTEGPVEGTMVLSPVSPVDANTGLTVTFTAWTDTTGPLSYAVVVDEVIVSAPGAAPARNLTSPLTPGAHTLKGRIYDALNNMTEVTQNFTVNTAQETWRKGYFGITANTSNAADLADPDGDGTNNLFEYIAGMVPNDSASVFRVRTEAVPGQPGQMAIKFNPLVAGRTYTVKYKNGLTDADWTILTDFTTSDSGGERTVIDRSAGPNRFYRVEIARP